MPPVLDQQAIGDCTCFAMGSALMFLVRRDPPFPTCGGSKAEDWIPSHLFLYYNGRLLGGGNVNTDSGLTVSDVCCSAATFGACHEKLWPYLDANLFLKPTEEAYSNGKLCKLGVFAQVTQNLEHLQATLVSGLPILFGFLVYDSFYTPTPAGGTNGDIPLPSPNDTLCGAHCALLVGYSNETKRFLCMNSWGTDFGDHGYFTLPYNYVLNPDLASDFYVAKKLEHSPNEVGQRSPAPNQVERKEKKLRKRKGC